MSTMMPIDSTSMSCEWVRENADAHALGALDQSDADRLERHVLGCMECDRFLTGLLDVVPYLALACDSVSPSHAVKDNLLTAIRAEFAPLRFAPRLNRNGSVGLTRGLPHWLRSGYVAVPVLALLLLLGGLTISSQSKLGSARDRVVALERENAAIALQLSAIRAGEAAFGDNANAYQLTRVNTDSGSAGGVILGDPNQSTALLSVWNMSGEDSYHVMCESERGEMLAAGELLIDERGVGSIELNLPATFTEYRAVHIVPGGESNPDTADAPGKDVLQVQLIDPTAVPIRED